MSARDFYLLTGEERREWQKKASFDAVCIPENTSLTKALAEMKKGEVPVALVIDEYGGATGVLKLKDIYEELIGDVNSEFEIPYWQVRKTGKNSWILSGNVPIQDIEEITNTEIEDITTKTLTGLFCEVSGKMPETGDTAVYKNLIIKVLQVTDNRIVSAELKKKSNIKKSG
jgi:CBS domain containing-hemolysin-like protein